MSSPNEPRIPDPLGRGVVKVKRSLLHSINSAVTLSSRDNYSIMAYVQPKFISQE